MTLPGPSTVLLAARPDQMGLRGVLEQAGHLTTWATCFSEALDLFERNRPQLVVVDQALQAGGVRLVEQVRKVSNTPILVLCPTTEVNEIVGGLRAGADDCVPRGVMPEELLARVRAHLRRQRPPVVGEVHFGGWVMDFDAREVRCHGTRVSFSPREFDLLSLLVRHEGKVFSRPELERKFWPEKHSESNVVDVYVGYLRRKMLQHDPHPYIHTLRSRGYVLRLPQSPGH
ncbi:DNA-binding response regulator [Deinococcus cellulosilyticus NBRC 106333 = KACC 11606]|uniref:DNA-binding response regulator n=1 Tax=Deinococcus cellulosilyticus (strain DSM 18568 / NBRC 106333 / KACC 11606 / 5516J-15) TaxID=1223518 RepID=A0A511N2N5_DEIC1|nr:DNA-binding response regulator [Deinococcus cellulosilyticus NBRC 106333 = KACC 11606]